jgi:hypothetical protein
MGLTMNNTGNYIIRNANKEDARHILELEYKGYDDQWIYGTDYIEEIIEKNSFVYRVLEVDGVIKGVYGLIPLNKHSFERLLSGEIVDEDATQHITTIEKGKDIYLYALTMVVNVDDKTSRSYTRELIKDLYFRITSLKEDGIIVKDMGAIAVTTHGERILSRLGFTYYGEDIFYGDDAYPVFRAIPGKVLDSIKL